MRVRQKRTRARRYQTGGSGEAIPKHIGQPETVLADNGYLNEDAVRILEGRDDEEAHGEDPPRTNVLVSAHAEARAKYRLRKQTVEPVFGTIKKWMGFTQFQLRGHENVSGEWQLVTLAYNMKRLWRMQSAQNQGI